MGKMSTDKHIIEYISCLNGLPVSELANISEVSASAGADLRSSITLLVSHPEQLGEDSQQEQLYTDALVDYATLSSRAHDLVPVGEMMKHDMSEYAFANHVHPQYDWFKAWPDFGPNGKDKKAEVSATLATVHFKNDKLQNDVQICLPKISYSTSDTRPKHLIGELMFVAAKSFAEVSEQVGEVFDIDAENFSGWVYPDGKTYFTKRFEFTDAKTAFGFPSTGASFTVPNLTGFFMPTVEENGPDGPVLAKRPGFNAVPQHAHSSATLSESSVVRTMLQSKQFQVKNGRGTSFGGPLNPDTASDQRKGIICPWPWDYIQPGSDPDPYLPAPKPWSYRYIDEGEAEMFVVKISDLKFKDGTKDARFIVKDLDVEEAGADYRQSDEDKTMSRPENVFIPVLVYVGFAYNDRYTYWE